jgi:hypothetical protein
MGANTSRYSRPLFSLLLALPLLSACANLDKSEQRMVSGAAIGGVIAGPIGAGVGAGIGYVVERSETSK